MTGDVVHVLSATEARALTDQIRQTLQVGHDLIAQAWQGQAWRSLGYESWDAYCAGEFAEARMVRLGREQRQEIVAELRSSGMSTRAIGSAIGVGQQTVVRDLAATDSDESVGEVTGVNGKSYAPTRAPTQPAEPAQPARRALPDQFFDAAFDFLKTAERIERLVTDDRFPRYAQQVGTKHRADLLRVQAICRDALDAIPDEWSEL